MCVTSCLGDGLRGDKHYNLICTLWIMWICPYIWCCEWITYLRHRPRDSHTHDQICCRFRRILHSWMVDMSWTSCCNTTWLNCLLRNMSYQDLSALNTCPFLHERKIIWQQIQYKLYPSFLYFSGFKCPLAICSGKWHGDIGRNVILNNDMNEYLKKFSELNKKHILLSQVNSVPSGFLAKCLSRNVTSQSLQGSARHTGNPRSLVSSADSCRSQSSRRHDWWQIFGCSPFEQTISL